MKPTWKRAALLVGLVVVLGAVGLLWIQPADPVVEGNPLSYWIRQLQSRSNRRDAEAAIREVGPRAIPILFARIRSEQSLQFRVKRHLWSHLPEVIRSHISAPREIDPFLPDNVGQAISFFGPPAVPIVVPALEDPNSRIRLAALAAFFWIGPDAASALPAVAKLLEDPSGAVRFRAVQTLAKMGPSRKQAVPDLIRLFDQNASDPESEKDAPICEIAIQTLGTMGTDASAAVPELKRLWKDPDISARGRLELAMALWRIDADLSIIPWFMNQLEAAQDFPTCHFIIQSLGEIGPKAKDAVPLIVEKMRDRRLARNFFGRDLTQVGQAALTRIDPAAAQLQAHEEFRVLDLKSIQLTNGVPQITNSFSRRAPRQMRRTLR